MKIMTQNGISKIEIPITEEGYIDFINCKKLPSYRVEGNSIYTSSHNVCFIDNNIKNQTIKPIQFSSFLFDYQKFIVSLCISRRKFAVFADCGLGKTNIFLEIIRNLKDVLPGKIIIMSPLNVIDQTINEKKRFYGENFQIVDIRTNGGIESFLHGSEKIGIINYEKLLRYEGGNKGISCLILDESSILKNVDGKTRTSVINMGKGVEFKFCFSATPAPNDRVEYANHAYFLDYIRNHMEFFTRFFVNKDGSFQLKSHAKDDFYRYLSEWSIFLRNPKNYGFNDNLRDMPPVNFHEKHCRLTTDQIHEMGLMHDGGQLSLFGSDEGGIGKKGKYLQLSRGFVMNDGKTVRHVKSNKVSDIVEICKKHHDSNIIIWVNYDEEGEIITSRLPGAMHLTGKTNDELRRKIINDFLNGSLHILISKPRILGFGINFQCANIEIFSGISDSYEQFYQAVKRVHRYGQTRPIHIYIPYTDLEFKTLRNVIEKKATFEKDSNHQEQLYIEKMRENINMFLEREEIMQSNDIQRDKYPVEKNAHYEISNQDCILQMQKMSENSIDLSVFSPPFASLYSYSSHRGDMGNSNDSDDEFALHFQFFLHELIRIMKPGRNVCMHVAQIALRKAVTGFMGIRDFVGECIRLAIDSGFIFYGDITVPKNPQAQAIRIKSHALMFSQFEKNSLVSRPAINDYLLIFKKPGDAEVPVIPECSRNDWIEWASGVWSGIRETNVLQVHGTKTENDEKHICPLQLDLIERCVRLWSNKNELVFSPFMGIGSEGVVSIEWDRKFLGTEIKEEYFMTAKKNLDNVIRQKGQINIFDYAESRVPS